MPVSAPSQTQLRIQLRSFCAVISAAAVATLVLASAAWCQLPTPAPSIPRGPAQNAQSLPAAQPTQIQTQANAAPTPHAALARVTFNGNQLTVAAQNSSLNALLSEIARLTGMKITGGVTDERVYGSYGPDSAEVVLNQLLDGTGTNVMLLETPQHTVAELVLTPRNGGPTPPSPNALREEEHTEESLPPALTSRRRDLPPGALRTLAGYSSQENRTSDQSPNAQQSQPNTMPPTNGVGAPQGDASQQSPNGVKTPQQIYDELVKQQAQQQQAPTSPPQ